MRFITLLLASCTLLVGFVSADELVTKSGRLLTIRKARTLEDGRFELTFKHGQIICSPGHVESVQIEGDMADYVPKNKRERENLAKGYVRHKGKWMSKNSYKTLLKKAAEASRKRVAELEAHSIFRNGYELETRHFKLKSNTSPERLRYYADLLEAYYKLMDDRVGINPTPTLKRTKMQVNIFKDRADWVDQTGKTGGVVGFFSPSEQTLNFFYMAEDPSITSYVALHECTHLLTYLIQPTFLPRIWVNEGVADFFGSAIIGEDKKGKLKITPGKLQVDRMLTVRDAIAADEHVRLEQLFRLEKSDFHSFEYAHAWSFVYFLNNHTKYARGFKKFFKDFYNLNKKVKFDWNGPYRIVGATETRRLLLASLKVKESDVPKLEVEWLKFIESVPLDAPDALFRRGLKVVQQGAAERYESATDDLEAALDGGIEDPRLFWALGKIKTSLKLVAPEGFELLEQAVLLDPFNPRFRASLGSAQLRHAFADRSKDGAVRKQALSNLGLASELAPDSEYYLELFEGAIEQMRKLGSGRAKSDQ